MLTKTCTQDDAKGQPEPELIIDNGSCQAAAKDSKNGLLSDSVLQDTGEQFLGFEIEPEMHPIDEATNVKGVTRTIHSSSTSPTK